MSSLLGKISLGIETYRRARYAIVTQFNPEKIAGTQNEKLKKLIHYCFDNIKYYRELFTTAGLKPEHIKSPDDLTKLPFLTKQQLRNRFWDFLPRQLPPCRVSRTSGSTGVPVCLLSDRNSRIFNSAAVIRYRQALGINLLTGPILTPLKNENEPNKKPHWTFLQGLHRTCYINPYRQDRQNIEYATKLLPVLKKPAIIGITPAIRALAYKVRDGIFPFFRPRVILTSGECLEPQIREMLESTFRTKVADIYSCNEAGDIAWQCPHQTGYHINADNVIVEIVKDDKPAKTGQLGEVVITNLNRFAMPIIRYKNGDRASLTQSSCPCGCKLPMIAHISGRTGQDIFLPGGRVVPWNQLKSLITLPGIRQFQLIQSSSGALTIRYVPDKTVDHNSIEELLLRRYTNLLGTAISIKTHKTNRIEPDPSGKSRLVISHYKPAE